MQKTLKRYFPIFVIPTLIAFSFAFLVPFGMGIYLSFCKFKTITNARFAGVENYIKIFEDRDFVLDFYFELRDFLNIFEGIDEAYRIYSELTENGTFMIKLFCMNPANYLKECLEKGRAAVFFSATLLPVLYYKELLSGNLEDYAVYAESPFPKENQLIMVAEDVSSKYTRRNQREFEKVMSYILEVARQKKGNYMVFFPSYQ